MAISSASELIKALGQQRILESAQLEECTHLQSQFVDPRALAAELVQRGWMTPFQANEILQDKPKGLLLGSFVLLDALGEGGMGQVFKARNWRLGNTVAIKLVRQERLVNASAMRRFQRELKAAVLLNHPNIVRAFDADEVDGVHLMVMEYVEGTNLAQLVDQNGPLPIEQACDYIRQAALGLQHAHECGLIHRDIKPSNLILTNGVIKILDMGLALLAQPDKVDGRSSQLQSALTKEGTLLGSADYMSPEQSLDAHAVDARTDLYSLGCTFYFLLTGQPPFLRASLTEKLLQHQMDEPVPVEQLRPEVLPGIAAVVRKLMAKRPDDRYPAAKIVAVVLMGIMDPAGSTMELPPTMNERSRASASVSLRKTQRRSRFTIGIVALVLVFILFMCYLALGAAR